MKKFFACIISTLLAATLLSSCSDNKERDYQKYIPLEGNICVEPLIRENAKELLKDSSDVFIGKVTDINFVVHQSSDRKLSGCDYSSLYTVYTVETETVYKGGKSGTVKVRLPGGLSNYKVEEQENLVNDYIAEGKAKMKIGENTVDYVNTIGYEKTECEIGKSYLFVTISTEGQDNEEILVPCLQGIFDVEDPTKQHQYESICAKDIIKRFGLFKWSSFSKKLKDGVYSPKQ